MSPRPGTVTAAVILAWLTAVLDIVGGVLLVAFAGNDDVLRELHSGEGTVRLMGVLAIGLGVLTAIIAASLARGSGTARLLVAVVMFVRILLAVWSIVWFGSHVLTESMWQILGSAVVVMLLYNAAASAWFRSGQVPT